MTRASNRSARHLLATALIGLATLPIHASPQAPSGPAATFLGGPSRGGQIETQGVDAPGQTVWAVHTDGPVRSSPIVADGVVYIGSHDGMLYAIDLEDGTIRWRYEVGEPVTAAPAVAGDVVVVNDRHGTLHGVGRVDGARRWIDRAGPALAWPWGLEGWDYVGSTPVVHNELVVAGSSDGRVRAVDARTGEPVWAVQTEGRVRSTPAVSDGTVFVGSADGIVRALDLATGAEQWRFRTHGADLTSADFGFDRRTITGGAAVSGGHVFIGSRDARLYVLDEDDGTLVWEDDDGGASAWVISTPAVTEDLVVFGRSSSAKIQGLDRHSGEIVWEAQLGGPVFASPTVVGGLTYVTDGAGSLVALDVGTGDVAWSRTLGAASWSSPTVTDGVVIVGADDGSVRAIAATDGPGPQLAVYVDTATATPSLSNGRGEAARVADALTGAGFEELSGESLGAWLEARVADGAPSSIVLATDVLPAAVAEGSAPEGLLIDYMRAGGRVVWTSVPPFWLVFDSEGTPNVDIRRPQRFLGIDFDAWVSDSRMLDPTPEGRRWGLEGWWTGTSGIDPAEVDVVLVTDEEGGAAGWVKSFGGPSGSGWVHMPYAPGASWLRGLRSVAEHGVLHGR